MAHRPGRFKYRAEYNLNQYDLPDEDHARRAYGYVQAYHKRPWKESPYRIPNEYICTRLGDLIGLPVPPCVLTYCDVLGSPTIFSSLNFNVDKNNLPPIEPDCCVKHLPMLSSGVLLFDIWIANEDRHEKT